MEYIPICALRIGHQQQRIRVRASRVWLHRTSMDSGNVTGIRMVLMDEKGNSIYAMIPHNLASSWLHAIQETAIYDIQLFKVSQHQGAMSPVDNPLVLVFTELTDAQLVLCPEELFPEWTYRLTSFTNLPSPSAYPRQFVDVIGVIRGISNIASINLPGGNIPVPRRHVLLSNSSGDEVRVTLWGDAAFRFNGRVLRFLSRTESAVVIFVAMTVHSYEGCSELAGAAPSRWYINVDIPAINILRASFQSSFEPIAQLPAPCSMNLQRPVNVFCEVADLSVIVSHALLQPQERPFRCVVQIWRFTPGQRWWFSSCARCGKLATPVASSSTQPDRYRCSRIGCTCTEAALEYHFRLLGSDVTAGAEFILHGKIARDLIGISAQRVILNNIANDIPVTNLACAANRICHIPPELSAITSSSYKFLIYGSANSFHDSWPSFNVAAVEALYPSD